VTGRLCWFGDKLASDICVKCENPVCVTHSTTHPLGIICLKCNEEENHADLMAIYRGWGIILVIIIVFFTWAILFS